MRVGGTFMHFIAVRHTMTEAGIYAYESAFLERHVQIGIASGRVLRVSFPNVPDEDAVTEHALLERIERYFEGTPDSFADVDVALTLPTQQRRILESLRQVPYGEQVSVKTLTQMTEGLDPEADADQDRVREALAANPAPIIIPDHRVRDGPSAAPPDVEQRLRSLENL